MKEDLIKEAVSLGQRLGRIFLTTADSKGMPHLSAAAIMTSRANIQIMQEERNRGL